MNSENLSEREGLERLESLVREKNYKEASAFASDMRDRFPSSFQIGFLYYRILVKLDKYADSENVLDQLLKLYPENINLLLEKGDLLIGRGKTAESKLFFEKVLFLDPFNSKAKAGVDRIKGKGSTPSVGFEQYEKRKVELEDTMNEADLERFMSDGTETENGPAITEEEDVEEIDISLSESHYDFRRPSLEDDGLQKNEDPVPEPPGPIADIPEKDDSTEIPEGPVTSPMGKVESALEELNSFSRSDLKDLGIEEEPAAETEEPEEDKEMPAVKEINGDKEPFVTESAALLYLKQGLYDDAKNVYDKLYRGSNEGLYTEKVEKVNRVEKANMKIIALEGFLEKIRTGSVRIV